MKTGVKYSSLYPNVFAHDSNRVATNYFFHYLFILAHHNFPEANVTSSNCCFCPTNSPTNPKTEVANGKQQIVTFKKLKPANV